jgi:hypothetical protein
MAHCTKKLVGLLLLLGVTGLGCSGSGGGDGGGGTSYASKRTATCTTWQDSMCDFIADKCQAQTRPECDELYQSLFCKDDATMQSCTGQLGSATCATPVDVPAGCKGINDPAPVALYCTDFAREVCRWGVRCKEVSDQAACESEAAAGLASTCTNGVGLAPSADACLADLQTHPCGGESPPSCKGVIKVLSSSPSADVLVPGTLWTTRDLSSPSVAPSPAAIIPRRRTQGD